MDDSDGDGDQFAVSTDLVQLPHVKEAGYSTIDFDGILNKPLELREDLAKGCGGALWPAGLVLAKYILQRRAETLRSKVMSGLAHFRHETDDSSLEIGAGGGLVG
jgi:hypothetical protein